MKRTTQHLFHAEIRFGGMMTDGQIRQRRKGNPNKNNSIFYVQQFSAIITTTCMCTNTCTPSLFTVWGGGPARVAVLCSLCFCISKSSKAEYQAIVFQLLTT